MARKEWPVPCEEGIRMSHWVGPELRDFAVKAGMSACFLTWEGAKPDSGGWGVKHQVWPHSGLVLLSLMLAYV